MITKIYLNDGDSSDCGFFFVVDSDRTQINFDAQFLVKSLFYLSVHYHLFIIIIAELKGHVHNFSGPQPSRSQMRSQSPIHLPASLPVFLKTLCFAYTQKLINLNISTLMMEAAYTSETSAISPTCTWCSNPSVINRCISIYQYVTCPNCDSLDACGSFKP
jgi:hypothetical protein